MILAVMNNKGGVLKTSITTSLSAVYAEEGKKVLLLDMDDQGNTSLAFGKNPDEWENTMYEVLMGEVRAEEAIYNVAEGIDLIPANHLLTFFELNVLTDIGPDGIFFYLRDAMKEVTGYDVILIDSPPNSGVIQGNILTYAEDVIVPFQPEPFAMRSLIRMIEATEDFREAHHEALRIRGVVFTLIDWRTRLHKDIMKTCEGFCKDEGIPLLNTKIPKSIMYSAGVAYQQKPVVLSKPKSKISQLYRQLKEDIERAKERS